MEIKLKEAKPAKSGIGAGLHTLGDYRHNLGNENKSQVPKHENRYITGLDEFSPSVKAIGDKKEREKKINELSKKREELEARLGVSLDQRTPEGKEFWLEFEINFDEIEYLNKTNPYDELMMIVLRENAFFRDFPVALTREDLGGDVLNAKDYYVVDNDKELEESVNKKLMFSRCVGKAEDWFNNDETKLRNVATLVLPRTIPIISSTPKQYVFGKIIDHLEGTLYEEMGENSKVKRLKDFLQIDAMSVADLDVKATVDKALKLNIISKNNSTGEYYNRAFTEYRYGKTIDEVYNYFKAPDNQREYGIGKKGDEEYSLKYLINQKER